MLFHEIEPFADAHITQIQELQHEMTEIVASTNLTHAQAAQLLDMRDKLKSAQRALTRFKVCAVDEWKTKERYEKYAKENGYKYS